MTDSPQDLVRAYIDGFGDWRGAVLAQVRTLVVDTDPQVVEVIRWGTPAFDHDGIVVWMFAARDWVHVSFPQGALLRSDHGRFEPTTNKAMRTIKIRRDEPVPVDTIAALVADAVEVNTSGRQVVFQNAGPESVVPPPEDMVEQLTEATLLDAYQQRPAYQRRGYVRWVEAAKRTDTRQHRLERMVAELREGSYMPARSDRQPGESSASV